MVYLVIVRHGQSEFNLQNRFTGIIDVSLTEHGREEALAASLKLKHKNIPFQYAFTSALARAHQTLNIILDALQLTNHIPVEKSAALNERNYGELQGMNKKETAEKFSDEQVHSWRRGFKSRPPGGESLEDTLNRVIPYYQKNIEPLLKQNKNILVVAHGNSLRALMMYLEKISEAEIENVEIATAIPRVYQFNDAHVIENVSYL
jgi:2,3-bisphosphoglycerate-dependent phosphoglycerate mutase